MDIKIKRANAADFKESGFNWFGNAPQWSLGQPVTGREYRMVVDKTTHRIRFENESETEVTVVVEAKE